MRIISQGGRRDLPYERTALTRMGKEIYVDSIKFEDLRIAKYSTEEKAIKAMEMCRQEYGKYYSVDGGVSLVTGAAVQPAIFNYPKIFQFPKDEEVEV